MTEDGAGSSAGAQSVRDMLFISYAIEDIAFVKWLALKLAACGYRVWWDKERLLGGGAFPTEIDEAIKAKAFRVLAVLSKDSAHKPNPERERTTALNLARARKENFLIPLNLGLAAAELPWMLANLTYIPFDENWATGLRQLLDELRVQDAPCWPQDAAQLVEQNLVARSFVVAEPEPVWLNFFEMRDAPRGIQLYEWNEAVPEDHLRDWIHETCNRTSCWALEPPPTISGIRAPACDQFALRNDGAREHREMRNAATSLLREYVERRCRVRGLVEIAEGRVFYFPSSLPNANRFSFKLPDGRGTWLRLVGTRRVWHGDRAEEIRYHLALSFRVELTRYDRPLIQVIPTAHFVGQDERVLESSGNIRRAKNLRRTWFNNKWLARVCGLGAFLADGNADWALSASLKTRVSGVPIGLRSPLRLDEVALFGSRREEPDDVDEAEVSIDEEGDEHDE